MVTPEIEARERSETCIYELSQPGICMHWLLKQKGHDRKPYLGLITIRLIETIIEVQSLSVSSTALTSFYS